MNILKKSFYVTVLLFSFSSLGFAKQAPLLPNAYNGQGLSARSFAMGRTGAAMPGSIEGVFYNPASLGFNSIDKVQIEALVLAVRNTALESVECLPYENINPGFNSFVIAQNIGAISWRTLSSYSFSEHSENSYSKMQENINAVTISMANKTDKGFSVGLNLSYLYGTVLYSAVTDSKPYADAYSGNGFTMDIGFLFPVSNNIFFGVNFENIVGFMWWEQYGHDQLPFGVRTGLGYVFGTTNFLVDYSKKFYRFGDLEEQFVNVGIEQYLTHYFAVRAGALSPVKIYKEKVKYSYGLGLNFTSFSLSAACETFKINEENVTQYFGSLKIMF